MATLKKKQFLELTLKEILQFDIENKEALLLEVINEKAPHLLVLKRIEPQPQEKQGGIFTDIFKKITKK